MRERRQYVRSNGLVLVNYKIPKKKLEGKSAAFDVCGTGLRITVEEQLPQGVEVEVEIYLPGSSQPILAKGKVVWVKEYLAQKEPRTSAEKKYFYAGITFTAIDEDSRTRIINYVHRKLHQAKK